MLATQAAAPSSYSSGPSSSGMQATPQQLQQPSAQQLASKARSKCAEVCMDLFTLETVRFMSEQQTGPAAASALQAIGIRVGERLAER
jgi:hypothetical protein